MFTGQRGRARLRVATRLLACLSALAALAACSEPEAGRTGPAYIDGTYELKHDSQGRLVRLNRITGEVVVVQGNQLVPVPQAQGAGVTAPPITRPPSRPASRPNSLAPTTEARTEATPTAAGGERPQAPVDHTITTAVDTPIFLMPNQTPTPLYVATVGSTLKVISIPGEWYRVEFHTPEGSRYIGFVAAKDLHAVAPASP